MQATATATAPSALEASAGEAAPRKSLCHVCLRPLVGQLHMARLIKGHDTGPQVIDLHSAVPLPGRVAHAIYVCVR